MSYCNKQVPRKTAMGPQPTHQTWPLLPRLWNGDLPKDKGMEDATPDLSLPILCLWRCSPHSGRHLEEEYLQVEFWKPMSALLIFSVIHKSVLKEILWVVTNSFYSERGKIS